MSKPKYRRTLDIDLPPGQSAFLWGARQTGKSTYLRERFPESVHIDLLDSDVALRLRARPSRLREMIAPALRHGAAAAGRAQGPRPGGAAPVIIDEVQKAPGVLDEVHRLIENEGVSFVLCGSSARQIRRAGVNLLGGRAWRFELFPLTYRELPDFDLLRALNDGLLPAIHGSPRADRSLRAYVRDYLTHEVVGEALTRNEDAFLRFFEALRFCHGELINHASIARDCGVAARTVRTYFEILRDTLVGHLIHPFHRREGRQSISSAPRFYLFDVGIAGQVCRRRIMGASGPEFGRAFEHFILMELVAARSYREEDHPIRFWRTKTGLEVDFVLGDGEVAIEVKSRVRRGDLRGLAAFREDFAPRRLIAVTAEEDRREVDGIEIVPYREFLEELHS